MKTCYKFTLTWLVIPCATALCGFTTAFAQSKADGKVRIHIEREVNGTTEVFDTSFTSINGFPSESSVIPPAFQFHEAPIPPDDPEQYSFHDFDIVTPLDNDLYKEKLRHEFNDDIFEKLESMKDRMNGHDWDWETFRDNIYINIDSMVKSTQYIIKDDLLAYNLPGMRDEDEKAMEHDKKTAMDGRSVIIYKQKIIKDNNAELKPGLKNEAPNSLQLKDLKIYPNPSDGKFSVSFHAEAKQDLKVRLTDVDGKEIFSEKIDAFNGDYSHLFDLNDKGKGIYILSIEQDKKMLTKRIVIN